MAVYSDNAHNINTTLVIAGKRTSGVRPPITGGFRAYPAQFIAGVKPESTVLQFSNTITGNLIETGPPDPFFQSGYVESIGIDGAAGLHGVPYLPNAVPDPTGPNFAPYAKGIHSTSTGFRVNRCRLFQIPGVAILLDSGYDNTTGLPVFSDGLLTEVRDTIIYQSYAGIENNVGDSAIHNCTISQLVTFGLKITFPCVASHNHIWGCGTKAAHFTGKVTGSNNYFEAAAIGTHFDFGSDGSRFAGLNFGPASCWQRGVLISPGSISISGLEGEVWSSTVDRPDVVGVEVIAGALNNNISGGLLVGDGSTGIRMRSRRSAVDIQGGGWSVYNPTGTLIEYLEPPVQQRLSTNVTCNGGVICDMSQFSIGSFTDGLGMKLDIMYDVNVANQPTPILYPGGGTTYNLPVGCEVKIQGRLQS